MFDISATYKNTVASAIFCVEKAAAGNASGRSSNGSHICFETANGKLTHVTYRNTGSTANLWTASTAALYTSTATW